MTENDLVELIRNGLDESASVELDEDEYGSMDIRTFGESGVLTSNKGLVVRIGDDEFQVTVVRSR